MKWKILTRLLHRRCKLRRLRYKTGPMCKIMCKTEEALWTRWTISPGRNPPQSNSKGRSCRNFSRNHPDLNQLRNTRKLRKAPLTWVRFIYLRSATNKWKYDQQPLLVLQRRQRDRFKRCSRPQHRPSTRLPDRGRSKSSRKKNFLLGPLENPDLPKKRLRIINNKVKTIFYLFRFQANCSFHRLFSSSFPLALYRVS